MFLDQNRKYKKAGFTKAPSDRDVLRSSNAENQISGNSMYSNSSERAGRSTLLESSSNVDFGIPDSELSKTPKSKSVKGNDEQVPPTSTVAVADEVSEKQPNPPKRPIAQSMQANPRVIEEPRPLAQSAPAGLGFLSELIAEVTAERRYRESQLKDAAKQIHKTLYKYKNTIDFIARLRIPLLRLEDLQGTATIPDIPNKSGMNRHNRQYNYHLYRFKKVVLRDIQTLEYCIKKNYGTSAFNEAFMVMSDVADTNSMVTRSVLESAKSKFGRIEFILNEAVDQAKRGDNPNAVHTILERLGSEVILSQENMIYYRKNPYQPHGDLDILYDYPVAMRR
ncbi:MAG: hypothetical protein CMF50_06170 [Legionellales bacterium]|nr:hypothetical protein [Legionellales bacterium]|tara:strand:- start:4084 stop:5094 length:1011 start_codon:yes stop_codon:yes gene_type:complete